MFDSLIDKNPCDLYKRESTTAGIEELWQTLEYLESLERSSYVTRHNQRCYAYRQDPGASRILQQHAPFVRLLVSIGIAYRHPDNVLLHEAL